MNRARTWIATENVTGITMIGGKAKKARATVIGSKRLAVSREMAGCFEKTMTKLQI